MKKTLNALFKSAAIFDCDGIIGDTEPLHYQARKEILGNLGVILDKGTYINKMMSRHWKEALGAVCPEDKLDPNDYEATFNIIQKRYDELRSKSIKPVPGIAHLVETLASHFPIAVASTQPEGTVRSVMRQTLGRFDSYFGVVVSGENLKRNKPAPDVYLEAARQLGINPNSCTAIEDSVSGVLSAKAAGMVCIGRESEWSTKESLAKAGADIVIKHYQELMN